MDQVVKRPRGRPRKQVTASDATTVQALERGLQLLSLLARERKTTLTEIALSAGMAPSTAHRLLITLQNHRFADFDENTQDWMIGVEAYRIGAGFLNRLNLVEAAQSIMHELMSETGETANLAIGDDGDVIFVSQIETSHPIRAFHLPGTRSNMHASAAGKALLAQLTRDEIEAVLQKRGLPEYTGKTLTKPADLFADLEQARRQGWAFDDEERYEGMRCIAAPIFGPQGTAIAAISVSGPSLRFSAQNIADFSAAVRHAASKLTEEVGGSV